MKRAGGGFDYSYNAQTAVDETAHIIVACELVNTSSDVQQLPPVLDAVKANVGASAGQVLADAGYRSEAVMEKIPHEHATTELVIALGREGKLAASKIDNLTATWTTWPPGWAKKSHGVLRRKGFETDFSAQRCGRG